MSDLCTISYQAEAFDSAAELLRRIEGWTVVVVPTDGAGERWTAEVGGLSVDEDETSPTWGEYLVQLFPWDAMKDEADHSPGSSRFLNIYDGFERLEVI